MNQRLKLSTSKVYVACLSILTANTFLLEFPVFVNILPAIICLLIIPGHIFLSIIAPNFLEKQEKIYDIKGLWILPVCSISIISMICFGLAVTGNLNQRNICLIILSISVPAIYSRHIHADFEIKMPSANGRSIREILAQPKNSPFSVLLIVSILLGGFTLFDNFTNEGDPWLEIYVTGDDGKIESIPENWSSSEPLPVRITVINHGFEEELIIRKSISLDGSEILSQENLSISKTDFSEDTVLILDNLTFSDEADYVIKYQITKSGEDRILGSLQILINYKMG